MDRVTYLLINLDRSPERLAQYKDDMKNHRMVRIKAVDYTNPQVDKHYDRQVNMWKIRPENKRKNVAIILSHLRALKYIIDNKIDNAVILEDDVVVDYKGVECVLPKLSRDYITQLGGHLWPPNFTMKKSEWVKPKPKKGFNKIDTSQYHIMGAYGYYIPRWELAKELHDWIHSSKRWRNYDNLIEKSPLKRYFVYPALVTINARTGKKSTAAHDKFKFNDGKVWRLDA